MSQYSANQFVDSDNHAWGLLFKYVQPKSVVLDIGCSSGTFGAVLQEKKQCIVDGIEPFHDDAVLARKNLRNVYELNIETDSLDKLKETYDCIIFADVIEHLVDPVATLQRVGKLLKPGGTILYSIPNMAHISIRLALLDGNFDHTETGLIDKTHLHFYTAKQIQRTFQAAHYKITDQKYTYVPYPDDYIEQRLEAAGIFIKNRDSLKRLAANEDAQAFQYIGRAEPVKGPIKHTPITELPHQKDAQAITKLMDERLRIIHELEQTVRNERTRYDTLQERLDAIENSKAYRAIRKATAIKKKLRN